MMLQKNSMKMLGFGTLRAFRKGTLQQFLDQGASLPVAKRLAEKRGCMLHKVEKKNLIVTAGYELMAAIAAGKEAALWGASLGTDGSAPTVSDTLLGTEIARNSWSYRNYAGAQVEFSTLLVASDVAFHVYEAGVFGGNLATSSLNSGTMFSHFLIDYDNSSGGADLTLDYLLTYQAE